MDGALGASAQLISGGLLLYFGAHWFVAGAAGLALAVRVPQLIIGLTVVAYGTSAPEVIVAVQAAAAGHGELAIGNVIGSNVANVGLVLGSAALISPARVDGALRRRELPVLVSSTLLLALVLIDGEVDRIDGAILLGCGAAYSGLMIAAARNSADFARATTDTVVKIAADASGAPMPVPIPRCLLSTSLGLAGLLVGGHVFVTGAVEAATVFGLSERLVGLTVVAIGTSLPELITSVIAARRGHSDLAVGNVLGSNIFNVFLCLGAAGFAGSVRIPVGAVAFDLAALLVMTVLVAAFIRSERIISRAEGAVAMALFVAYMAVTIARG